MKRCPLCGLLDPTNAPGECPICEGHGDIRQSYRLIDNACQVCSAPIMAVCPTCLRPNNPLPEHRQFLVTADNQKSYYIGVCATCLTYLKEQDTRPLFEGLREWLFEHGQEVPADAAILTADLSGAARGGAR